MQAGFRHALLVALLGAGSAAGQVAPKGLAASNALLATTP